MPSNLDSIDLCTYCKILLFLGNFFSKTLTFAVEAVRLGKVWLAWSVTAGARALTLDFKSFSVQAYLTTVVLKNTSLIC